MTSPPRIDPALGMQFAIGESSLGLVLVARSARGVSAVFLGDDRDELVHALRERFPSTTLLAADTEITALVATIVDFIEAPARGLDVPLDLQGTEFQRKVWKALRDVPAGSTASYTDIATRIGLPKSVRAVAQACAANPLAVIVPCHRILRRDGQLAGYRWGIERKRSLLERERETAEERDSSCCISSAPDALAQAAPFRHGRSA